MNPATERLITTLAADAAPIRRPPAPLRRTIVWTSGVGLAAAAVLVLMGSPAAMHLRLAHPWNWPELAATLATATCGVLSAFSIAIPGRSRLWLLAPVPPALAWLLTTLWGLATMPRNQALERTSESFNCFGFVVIVGAMAAVALTAALRRTGSIEPRRSLLAAGVGAGAIATFLLAFCHPFELNLLDVGAHFAGMLVVAIGTVLLASRGLERRSR